MPKEPRNKMSSSRAGGSIGANNSHHNNIGHSVRHAPLGQVIQDDVNRGKFATRKKMVANLYGNANNKKKKKKNDDDDDEFIDEKTSRKILDLSRDQRHEMEEEDAVAAGMAIQRQQKHARIQKKSSLSMRKNVKEDSSDDDDDDEKDGSDDDEQEEDDELIMVEQDDLGYVNMSTKHIGLTPEEEALLSNMMGNTSSDHDRDTTGQKTRNLADIIMAKIQEKEAMAHRRREEKDDEEEEMTGMTGMMELPPKVVQVYTDIGKLLTHYTSGKLPKAFKVVPSLHNWEEVLYLTRPDTWTPQAMYAATRIFASNLNPKMAQRFYNLVLLDAVRADIYSNKKLNYHYYMAIKKSVYKPAAFFKGILLPLCKENCTLREAIIVASVLQKVSIPVHHSAVAIHKLALMTEYNGATSIFIKTLLNKKYSLPAPVITSLIEHFVRFQEKDDVVGFELPVLWHQALLAFVQRYKNDIDVRGKEQLRDLMKVHNHAKITVEVRRELFGSAAWREEREQVVVVKEQPQEDGDSMVM